MDMQRSRMRGARSTVNVDYNERLFSIIAGGALALYGIFRLPLSAVAALLGGGYLLYRGVTGRCLGYQAFGINTALSRRADLEDRFSNEPPPGVSESDPVTEASWESFPTSDPPSWTMGRRGEQ